MNTPLNEQQSKEFCNNSEFSKNSNNETSSSLRAASYDEIVNLRHKKRRRDSNEMVVEERK